MKVIRCIGVILILAAFVSGYFSIKDDIFNGLELLTISLWCLGGYFSFASKSSLKSWIMK